MITRIRQIAHTRTPTLLTKTKLKFYALYIPCREKKKTEIAVFIDRFNPLKNINPLEPIGYPQSYDSIPHHMQEKRGEAKN